MTVEMMAVEYPAARKMALAWLKRMGLAHEDAEDIVQTATVSALAHLASFRGESKFSSWFMRIVINTSKMAYRSARAKPLMVDAADVEGTLPGRSNPEREYSCTERAHQVVDAGLQLSPCRRNAFLLHFCGEQSFIAIAESEGVTPTAVKCRSHHAARKIREALCSSHQPSTAPRA